MFNNDTFTRDILDLALLEFTAVELTDMEE